jgi:hypothetical protein
MRPCFAVRTGRPDDAAVAIQIGFVAFFSPGLLLLTDKQDIFSSCFSFAEYGIDTVVGGPSSISVWNTMADTASFVVHDSHASFIYAVGNYKPSAAGTNFAIRIRETQHGVSKSLL